MRRKLTIVLACLFLFMGHTQAQQRGCATQEMHDLHMRTDAKYAEKQAQIEAFTSQFVANYNPELMATNTVTIPVVFHIVHDGDAVGSNENISDALVMAQLQQLNDDYRKLNSDSSNVPSEFAGVAADMQIEFCLATVDPNGNATTGINRINGGQSSWSRSQIESNLKPNSIWDRDSYLNFWTVQFGGSDSNLLGYAQFPGGAANTDGVVCRYTTVGSLANPHPDGGVYARGRTGTHEVGHWLNLRHIWGDDGTGCTGSDLVDDTPNQGGSYGGSPSYPQSSCGSNDMFMNYMDYVYDTAMYMFSEGQKARSQALFTGSRASLLNSNGCGQGTTPTCNDGVQNGDETGVDCGGSSCQPCSTSCTDNEVTLTITFDNYPEETSWTLTNDGGQTVASGGTYNSQPDGSTLTETFCLPNDCYTFTLNDSYGDGICCNYGNGSYSLVGPNGTIASGGSFTNSVATNFCFGGTAPTCDDGIQNGDETGVDCGGSCTPCETPPTCDDGIQNGDETGVDCGGSSCAPCATPPTCDDGIQNGDEEGVDCGGSSCQPCATSGSTLLHEGYFESGWDGWVDGGSDSYRYSGSRSYENSYSIRLRDNSGTASSMTLNNLSTAGYDQVEVKFYFYPNSMESGEDFWLRFNDGSGWQTVASWASGSSFNNGSFYVATVVLNASDYNFGAGTDFRFQCDASTNQDQVYIDQVTITGINGAGSRTNDIQMINTGLADNRMMLNEDLEAKAFVYPNPTSDVLNISAPAMRMNEQQVEYQILSTMGKVVMTGEIQGSQVNVSELPSGMYIIMLSTDGKKESMKFIKR